MRKLRTKYRAWIQRRRARFTRSWALRRAKGKIRFLVWGTTVTTLALISGEMLIERSWNKVFEAWPLKVVIYLGISLTVVVIDWRENERAYRRYLTEAPKTELDPPISTRDA